MILEVVTDCACECDGCVCVCVSVCENHILRVCVAPERGMQRENTLTV